ncbi:hypothetical protein HYS93_00930 [Candidatus Daviesbacteria bacterium]|nr:hypothetical protein [Candidatus Daviesbacteria bacterium]
MNKFLLKYLKFVIILVIFLTPQSILAESPSPNPSPTCAPTELGCIPQDPFGFTSTIYGIGLGFIGTVALFFIIYGGYLILTSKGDSTQLARGRSYIISAIIGIIMAVSGFAIYRIVAVDVVKLPGFK